VNLGNLHQNGLRLALVAVVPGEALADTRCIVADSTSGTVASLDVSELHRESGDGSGRSPCVEARASEGIGSGRALDKRAVRTTETIVTLAAIVVASIPGIIVLGTEEVTVCGCRRVGELNGKLAIISVVRVIVCELLD
jgi:hypothetical protein